jgi:DNA processing protein
VTENDLFNLFKLYSVPGIGPGKLRLLLSKFGSPKNVFSAPLKYLMQIPGIDKKSAERIKWEFDEQFAKDQIRFLKSDTYQVQTFWQDTYPALLKRIYDPPAFLFMRGSYTEEDAKAFAIVGTRNPTLYGQQMTRKLTKELTAYGLTIVSGLARGVDTIAHQTAIQNGSRTIAVLGSGLDYIYPRENRGVAERITSQGAVYSEYPFGTLPDSGNFPRRNRIISGLSLGVLIVEAGIKSGALITAFEALEQNRAVFAVPGPINSEKSAGTNQLLKEGATLVQTVDDILNELELPLARGRVSGEQRDPELANSEKKIYNLLSDEPIHIDRLAQLSQKSPAEVLSLLLKLELMGYSKQMAGKLFIRS